MPAGRVGRAGQGRAFWKIAAAGATFQAGSSAVDSATVVASLAHYLTGSPYVVGATSALLRLGWLLPQLIVGFLAQRSQRRMPYYVVGAFGRASCLAVIGLLLVVGEDAPTAWVATGFLGLWTLYAFVSGIVAVPYNDIVARSIPSQQRSRLLAWRFFGGGVVALAVAGVVRELLAGDAVLPAYGLVFALASALMFASSISFVLAGEPPAPTGGARRPGSFAAFLEVGRRIVATDRRFRLFLFTQWLGGATLMALPFYVVAASVHGLGVEDVALLLGAQTVGSLASNALWGRIGDRFGKLALLKAVGLLRLLPPLGMLLIVALQPGPGSWIARAAFGLLFIAVGALVNGVTIGYLGYLMEISPDPERPTYSAVFNACASPAALLPLVGAALADAVALEAVFAAAIVAAAAQLVLYRGLGRWERRRSPALLPGVGS